jgi:hypothetical protein
MKITLLIFVGLFGLSGCAGEADETPSYTNEAPVYARIRSAFSIEGTSEFPDSLANPHPNPYNRQLGDSSIFISFTLSDSADVKVIIQNPIGDSVAFFEDDVLPPGSYGGWWTPVNALHTPLRAGLYFVTLRADPERRNYIDSKLLYIENND